MHREVQYRHLGPAVVVLAQARDHLARITEHQIPIGQRGEVLLVVRADSVNADLAGPRGVSIAAHEGEDRAANIGRGAAASTAAAWTSARLAASPDGVIM